LRRPDPAVGRPAGAGPSCSGQVLVYHDLLGMMSHPHHAKVGCTQCLPRTAPACLTHARTTQPPQLLLAPAATLPAAAPGAAPACGKAHAAGRPARPAAHSTLTHPPAHPTYLPPAAPQVTPKFCKQYARVGEIIQGALQQYREDVSAGHFPGRQYSPYKIPPAEVEALVGELRQRGMAQVAHAVEQYSAEQQQQQQQGH
jgi:hypothetical protein